ncbi:MAG: polyprenyl synthetase family protein [Flavobacteriales bacterium]|nr:polyprenyl synthetase family protein [Flavobacteriales bacterium]MCB9174590.1 polyprenyl synthetase family protein [Flavobacteriales bacterium]
MATIKEIQQPIAEEMEKFESWFRDSMKSRVSLLDNIMHYIIKRKGKQMRPMFVFLSSKVFAPTTDSTYIAASMIELLHTATLVHDDVVDDANKRRGFWSINAIWKNKIAVLVGDYLLSKGLLLAVDNKEFELLQIMSNSVREMSEGELLQIEKARRLDITEDIYFDIIRQKTATLIAACCAAGASSAKANPDDVAKMRLFGEYTGIAFQIKDDLFDYGSDGEKIGKPTGIDIKEKKMTLPLIYALNRANYFEKRRIISIIKNHNQNTKKVKEVIDFVIASGGLEYAHKAMLEYKNKALAILKEFDQNEANIALSNLVIYTTERTK